MRTNYIGKILENSVEEEAAQTKLEYLITIRDPILDVLLSFMLPIGNNIIPYDLRTTVTKLHIFWSYRAYQVDSLNISSYEINLPYSYLTRSASDRFTLSTTSQSVR